MPRLESRSRRAAAWSLAAITAFTAACASGPRITTDFDPAANFQQYHTYSWHVGTPATDPLVDSRIINAINTQMMAKGFQKVDANGDLVVTYHAQSGAHVNLQTVYSQVGWGPGWGYGPYWCGRRWGWAGPCGGGPTVATTTADTVRTGTVVVDILDGKTHNLVWRGVASDELAGNPQDLAVQINEGAARLFEDFPPKTKT
jgi:hypothetical protein